MADDDTVRGPEEILATITALAARRVALLARQQAMMASIRVEVTEALAAYHAAKTAFSHSPFRSDSPDHVDDLHAIEREAEALREHITTRARALAQKVESLQQHASAATEATTTQVPEQREVVDRLEAKSTAMAEHVGTATTALEEEADEALGSWRHLSEQLDTHAQGFAAVVDALRAAFTNTAHDAVTAGTTFHERVDRARADLRTELGSGGDALNGAVQRLQSLLERSVEDRIDRVIHDVAQQLATRLRETIQRMSDQNRQLAGLREIIGPIVHEIVGSISDLEQEGARVESRSREIHEAHERQEADRHEF